jgi:hypothetical protein
MLSAQEPLVLLIFVIVVAGENDMHTVEGFIIDRNKNKLRFLYGRWNEFLCAADPEVGYYMS